MYTERDREQILEDMLEAVRDDVDKREGSVVFDMLAPPAEELEMLGFELEAILENGFINTAQAQFVDLRAAEIGLFRKEAIRASGWVTIQDEPGREIEIGTKIVAEDDGEFVTLEVVDYEVIPESGEVTVRVIAELAGADGNIKANSNLSSVDLPLANITNPIELLGGLDEESDEELKARYMLTVQRPNTSGNAYHYELWAREVPGISEARVIPVWDGSGTVKIIVIDNDGKAPSAELVASVQNHIEEVKPIGPTVTVVAIDEIAINVSATLVLVKGTEAIDVQDEVKQNIENYLKSNIETVRYSQIAAAILETDGVKDYNNLLVNGGVSNIEVTVNSVPVVGGVTLT